MDSTLNPAQVDPHQDGGKAPLKDQLVGIEEALSELMQGSSGRASDRRIHVESDTFAGLGIAQPLPDATLRPADLKNDRFPSKRPLAKRASRALARFVITFCIGVAATLAWQSYGDAAREMIASSSPQLGWLAPQTAPVVQTPPDMIAPAVPATLSSDRQQLNAMGQSIDQLAAGQEQMRREITKLRAAVQEILDKISVPPPRPAVPPAHKPVPPTLPSQAPPTR
jgi:hypothetical protein